MFFNSYELNKLEKSQYAGQLKEIEKEYAGTFAQKRKEVNKLELALDAENEREIDVQRTALQNSDKKIKEIRQKAVDLMVKNDRMSMAHSLEARVPLLDHPLVEFAVALPSSLKLRDGTGKWIFRKAIQGIVPDIVLTKPKQGFAVPLPEWLRGDLRHRAMALLRPDSPIYEFVEPKAVRRLVSEHQSRRRGRTAADHVLIRAANVGRDDLQDDTVLDLLPLRVFHFRIADILDLDLSGLDVNHTSVVV